LIFIVKEYDLNRIINVQIWSDTCSGWTYCMGKLTGSIHL